MRRLWLVPALALVLTGCASEDPRVQLRDEVADVTNAANIGSPEGVREQVEELLATVRRQVTNRELSLEEGERIQELALRIAENADLARPEPSPSPSPSPSPEPTEEEPSPSPEPEEPSPEPEPTEEEPEEPTEEPEPEPTEEPEEEPILEVSPAASESSPEPESSPESASAKQGSDPSASPSG